MRKFSLLRFGIKAGIMSSAVYLTIDQGVWKDNETTGQLYESIQKNIKPFVKPLVEQIPFEVPQLPKTGDFISTAKTTWNKGVIATTLFLVELPPLAWEYAKKGSVIMYEKLSEQLRDLKQLENDENSENKKLANKF